MNKKSLRNYWISTFVIIIGIFFFNTTSADVKIQASEKITKFLDVVQKFASEKEQLNKAKKSAELLDMIDIEFMSKVTVGKTWKTVNDNEKIIFKRKLFNKFVDFINLHLEDFKEIKFNQTSIKLRGKKLIYVNGSIDTKKIKNLNVTWKLSSNENKILDIEIEKISLIKTQKLEMKKLLKENKDNFSNFIKIYFKK